MYEYWMAIRYAPATKPKPTAKPKASRKGIGGRPRKSDALVAVTLRICPVVLKAWEAKGPNWRQLMAEALKP